MTPIANAGIAAHSHVGQVVNLRRIGNPPAGSTRNSRETPPPFVALRFVGQPILATAASQPARFGRAAPHGTARVSKRTLVWLGDQRPTRLRSRFRDALTLRSPSNDL